PPRRSSDSVVRHHPRIRVRSPVRVWPAVEAAFLHGGQVVGYEVGTQLITLVDHRPQLARARLDGQRGRVAQATGVFTVHAGQRVDLPDHRAVLLRGHATLGDVAVRADAHVQIAPVGAGGHRLGPVVVDLRWQRGDRFRRTAGAGLPHRVVEAHQLILVGDVQAVVDQ